MANEGCLSLPEHYADVERAAEIRLRYLDHENEIREIEAKGLLATCLQHEIDHLDGVLFVDHISALKRGIILRKLAKTKRSRALAPAQYALPDSPHPNPPPLAGEGARRCRIPPLQAGRGRPRRWRVPAA